jgi:hypothetical protein
MKILVRTYRGYGNFTPAIVVLDTHIWPQIDDNSAIHGFKIQSEE